MATTSELVGAIPSGSYSWRPPSPPHIHVPQAAEDQKFVLPAYNGISGTEADQEILRVVTQGNHTVVARDWKYEWRRKAQPILTFLHLGPSSAARDLDYLKTQGITMLLVVRDTRSAHARLLSGEKVAQQLGIEATAIDVSDYQQLIAAFPRAVEAINDHLISMYRKHLLHCPNHSDHPRYPPGKVLVFCESGNERSACVVAAYLMHTYGLDLVTAVQYIQTQRFCVAFDDTTKNLLLNYQTILEAKKAVAGVPVPCSTFSSAANAFSQPKSKRGRDEVDLAEEDMDLDDADDQARFFTRNRFVPFYDRDSKPLI